MTQTSGGIEVWFESVRTTASSICGAGAVSAKMGVARKVMLATELISSFFMCFPLLRMSPSIFARDLLSS
jgi:hypothetical protein